MKPVYESPLASRYASKYMLHLFSPDMRFETWRRLWVSLAKAQHALGLPVSREQVEELAAHISPIDYKLVAEKEKELRHDVMAHVYAYGVQCPKAAGIIHLGATSCYVGDNTDIVIMKEALVLVRKKLINVIALLAKFADSYKALPCLAYTHLQPAQLTTVGKRATLWINELYDDLCEVEHRISSLKLLGSKGTTGTQASFVELFDGDGEKIDRLEAMIAEDMGFSACVPVSGQTYSRKTDYFVLSTLCGIAQTASKFANDLRILQSFKEMEEPFEKHQIGSSAMPYKRNPMRAERITALARYVMNDSLNPAFTAATQWFERTLDDSANRRIAVSEAFLGTDAILNLLLNVCDGLVVYPKVITARVMRELPFMATENIMMHAVKKGGDRQQLHEKLREHSLAAAARVKEEGEENDLIDRIVADPAFGLSKEEIDRVLLPQNFTGRSREQVDNYLNTFIRPLLEQNADLLGEKAEISV